MTTGLEYAAEFSVRRKRVLPLLQEARVGALVITALPNVRYLSGFTGSNAALLITGDRSLLFTDPRYEIQASAESDCELKVAKGPLTKELLKWIPRLRIKSLAFEQNRISFDDFQQLKNGAQRIRLKPLSGVVEKLRMVKSAAEIAAIKRSVQLNSKALEQALGHFKPSMSERDLAAEIGYRMRRLGADREAFETIVASGNRSALPHAQPTGRPIQPNQLLLIDMGASVAGYASDMSRTHAVGRPTAEARRMYGAVLESQLVAIDAVRPGVSCAAVDRAARKALRAHRLDDLFIHSTGHGLGLEIHEAPRLGRKERTKLQPGMAITIEPGVYVEGLTGIRIEDTVVVTPTGYEVLTPTQKELVVL
ncbi:MAG: M24 family metallopeptidase [Bryobacteraceae bacterium]